MEIKGIFHSISCIIIVALIFVHGGFSSSAANGQTVKAFPTAEGFGANSVGGRGGRVIEVTNLNDSGSGSLRNCVANTGPRTCVFRVGGTIALNSTLNIQAANSYLTIAGQTAPGDGIQLKNWYIQITYGGHDVIIRHLRIRQGAGNNPTDINNQCGGIIFYGPGGGSNTVYNIIIDHASIEWACDDSTGSSGQWKDSTIQWSLIGEGLNGNDYPGANSKGLIMGDYGGSTATVHHNMFLDLESRVPYVAGTAPLDYRNNIAYNWHGCTGAVQLGRDLEGMSTFNFVGNKYVAGPNSNTSSCAQGNIDADYAKIYALDNSTPWCERNGNCGSATLAQLGFLGADRLGNPPFSEAQVRVSSPFSAPPITMTPIGNLESVLSANVGATKPSRDALDSRLISEFQNRSGSNGRNGASWPNLANGTPPTDSDHDGMPDSWEIAHGLNPQDPSDGPKNASNGYTSLENYLNELAGDSGTSSPLSLPTPTNLRVKTVTP